MRRRNAGGRILLLWLVIASILLTGCSSIFSEEPEASGTATPAPVEMIPQAGGDLFIAIPSEITSFDPLTVTNEDLVNFLTLIYETPFKFNENGQLVNSLVDSWDVSPDRTIFTFHFREDVYFSDGDQMTAEDVESSAKRVLGFTATPEPEPTESASPSWQTNLSNRYAIYNHDILSVDASDEFTLTLTMTEPSSAGLYFMTFPVMKTDFRPSDLPMGTGPYQVESYVEGEQALLTVNPLWWQDPPFIERIVANAVESPSEKMELLETSILDFVTTTAINAGNYNIADKWQVIDYMTDYYDCLVPNLQSRNLSDIRVRTAISEAVDRRELLSTVLLNHGVPSSLPLAPDFFAVDSRYRSGQANQKQALELLEQAGYRTSAEGDNVLRIQLIVPDTLGSTYKREAARAIVKQLEEVFIEVEIEELSETDYMEALEGGEFDLAYCSYYLTEVPNLSFMFDTNGIGNYGHVNDPELEEAIRACGQALTESEIIDAYAVLQRRLAETLPQIGLYFRMNSIICDVGIHGIGDVRQNAVFSDVSRWFNAYFAQSVPETSSGASPSAEETTGQTEPESIADIEGAFPSAFGSIPPRASSPPAESTSRESDFTESPPGVSGTNAPENTRAPSRTNGAESAQMPVETQTDEAAREPSPMSEPQGSSEPTTVEGILG